MVYRRNGRHALRGIVEDSGTAAPDGSAPVLVAFQLIVFHAGDAQFAHLLVLPDRSLGKPSFPDKEGPERKCQESHSQQDKRYDQYFQHVQAKLAF